MFNDMKKVLVTMLAVLTTVSMFAIKPITLEGKFNVKKNKGAVAVYSLNWDNTQVGEIDDGVFVKGSMPINEWLEAMDQQKVAEGKSEDANYVKDWAAIKDEADKYFKEEWNDEFAKKGVKLTHNEAEANYRIDFYFDGLDWGNSAAAVFGFGRSAGGAIVMGHADVTDIASGEKVATFKLNHVQGSGHFTDRFRILLVMHQLVDEIDDLY